MESLRRHSSAKLSHVLSITSISNNPSAKAEEQVIISILAFRSTQIPPLSPPGFITVAGSGLRLTLQLAARSLPNPDISTGLNSRCPTAPTSITSTSALGYEEPILIRVAALRWERSAITDGTCVLDLISWCLCSRCDLIEGSLIHFGLVDDVTVIVI